MEGKIIYPELSYKIMGILFEVHNKLGCRYQEKYCQRAVEVGFADMGLNYGRVANQPFSLNQKTVDRRLKLR